MQVLALQAEWPLEALSALVVHLVGVPLVQWGYFKIIFLKIVFKLKNVLKVFLKNRILNCKLRVGIATDVDEGIKTQNRVSSDKDIASAGGSDSRNTLLLFTQHGSLSDFSWQTKLICNEVGSNLVGFLFKTLETLFPELGLFFLFFVGFIFFVI